MTAQYDFTWEQGEDIEINVTYKQGTPAVAVDLTGYNVRMDIRDSSDNRLYTLNSADIVEVPSVDNTGASDNEATLNSSGLISITIPRSATIGSGALVATLGQTLKYDIFLRSPSNKQKKILKGEAVVNPSVTRWA